MQNVTFTVKVFQPEMDQAKFAGGAVSERIMEYQAGAGIPLMLNVSGPNTPSLKASRQCEAPSAAKQSLH